MTFSASRNARRMALSVCTVTALLAAVPAAGARPVAAELRVQGEQKTLASGETYLTDTTTILTDTSEPACGGSGDAATVEGATALGLLIDAAGVERTLRPLGVSDKFDFGLLVCSIGGVQASDDGFWLYKVNHVAPDVGADQRKISPGDEVLWYFSNTATGRNTGDELALDAPPRAKPFTSFDVRVVAYDAAGKPEPAAGADVVYGQQRVRTDSNGVARVTSGSESVSLRAVRGKDVASARERVCVSKRPSACVPAPTALNGTAGGDRIVGGQRAERVFGHGGRDRIDVRGGGSDVVRCGSGVDRALIDRGDRAGRDCEFVNDRRRGRAPAPKRAASR